MGEVTQEFSQSQAVALGFPPLSAEDPLLPKCGEWPQCNRTGRSSTIMTRSCWLQG
jgi:hypothetical protein